MKPFLSTLFFLVPFLSFGVATKAAKKPAAPSSKNAAPNADKKAKNSQFFLQYGDHSSVLIEGEPALGYSEIDEQVVARLAKEGRTPDDDDYQARYDEYYKNILLMNALQKFLYNIAVSQKLQETDECKAMMEALMRKALLGLLFKKLQEAPVPDDKRAQLESKIVAANSHVYTYKLILLKNKNEAEQIFKLVKDKGVGALEFESVQRLMASQSIGPFIHMKEQVPPIIYPILHKLETGPQNNVAMIPIPAAAAPQAWAIVVLIGKDLSKTRPDILAEPVKKEWVRASLSNILIDYVSKNKITVLGPDNAPLDFDLAKEISSMLDSTKGAVAAA